MGVSNASAKWNGALKEGSGEMKFTGYEGPFTFASRFEDGAETNPEELVGAANAGCFSMFLSALLGKEDITPNSIETTAAVHLGTVDGGPKITKIELDCVADIPGISDEDFQKHAAAAKANCPISKLFAGTEITLTAKLAG
jgi:osmotically inducible protein OsmC